MIILDTDHLSILRYVEHPRCETLRERLRTSGQRVLITMISVEEEMRGWLAEIRRRKEILEQLPLYQQLTRMIRSFRKWRIAALDELAATQFTRLKMIKIHVGTQDLKIASIALANDALLLSANLRDFRQVPGLRVENWLS